MDKLILKIPDNDKISLCFDKGGSGAGSYPPLSMKPSINEVTVLGDKEGKDYNLQDLLIAGQGIQLTDNGDHTTTISAEGTSAKHYTHNQLTPSAEWRVEHNLDKYPAVTVVDSAGSVVIGEVQYISTNAVLITFRSAFSGSAYFN